MFFGGEPSLTPFTMFSLQHLLMIVLMIAGLIVLYATKNRKNSRVFEISIAFSLIIFEIFYHVWLLTTDQWRIHHALPLELSNFSVFLAIILLFNRNRTLFEIAFLVGIGGALQAVATPVLSYGWPHFRFIHFFYTHIAVIWIVFYFLWHYRFPLTFVSVVKAMLFLNILLPFIWFVNVQTGGNYWFIMEKPKGDSLLDLFGDHPWHILGMEAAAVVMFSLLVLLFGNANKRKKLSG